MPAQVRDSTEPETFRDRDPIARFVRLALLAILALGILGTCIELLLLKHTEGWWQWAPIVLMALALPVIGVVAVSSAAAWVRALRILMLVFVLAGVVGIWLHYRGNAEWELERMASLSGLDLFRHAVMGATPTLAPGTMVQLGLVGLLYTYRHPALRRRPEKLETPGTTI